MPVASVGNSGAVGNGQVAKPIENAGIGGGNVPTAMNANMAVPFMPTPAGNVRSLAPPPLPMAPTLSYGYTLGNGYRNYSPNYGNVCAGNYLGLGGYNSFGNSYGYGNGFRNYDNYGMGFGSINAHDPEARFIQLAEASTRSAFQSIETLVMTIGNIASMLESTFFALTSSFRAILSVAANFGRLRGVFTQFWENFFFFRALNWLYRKLCFWLRISKYDPSSEHFNKAFAEAAEKAYLDASNLPTKNQSSWPIMIFLGFIFTAPYVIMRILKNVSNTVQGEVQQPSKWVSPIQTVAIYDFQARNSSELSFSAGQSLCIAPKEVQNVLCLLNTGWALATADGQNVGIIPINYVKSPQQMRQEHIMKSLQQQKTSSLSQHQFENGLDLSSSSQTLHPESKLPNASESDCDISR